MFLIKAMSLFLSGTLFFSIPFFPMSILSGLFSKEKNYAVHSDIKYGNTERNLVDIYVPKSAYQRDYNAVILFIHGGSWNSGDKNDMRSYCETYAEKGYITATMSYTLVTEENGANAFTMLDEINLVIKQIKKFSDEEKLNIIKIATCGFSAGGHISSLYAYTRANDSAIEVAFTANKVAPSDFHSSNWDINYGEGTGYALACALAGKEYNDNLVESGEIEDIIASVSPAMNIDKNSVPTIAGYGGKDTVCPVGNAYATLNALIDSGIDYDFILYPNSNHGLLRDWDKDAQYKQTFLDYCEKYFGYAPQNGSSQDTEPTEPDTNPDSKRPDNGSVGSSSNTVTKPNSSIPDTNNESQTYNEFTSDDNITNGNIAENTESNADKGNHPKKTFIYKKEVILSAVLLAAVIGTGSAIFIIRKRTKK